VTGFFIPVFSGRDAAVAMVWLSWCDSIGAPMILLDFVLGCSMLLMIDNYH